jgi:ABC-type phosphate/phosphonate transport system ATPase subunit
MTFNNIYEYFKDDANLLDNFDPTSKATNNEEAAMEIYHKLVEHAREKECHFKRNEVGYIFYSGDLLISFCVKPELRTKDNLAYFGNLIKHELGQHFKCFLFNNNKRAINFLERLGMKQVKSNNLITLLSI